MTKKKVTVEETKHIIDHETGEMIITENTKIGFVDREPDYVKLYVKDIGMLKGIKKSSNKVLMEIIGQMGYNNLFIAYAPIKRNMCKILDMKMSTINMAIDDLYKSGILLRAERGVYLVDPELFARGKWSDIKKVRLMIEYDRETNKRVLRSDAPEQLKLNM
jgi:hypothetical protein